MRIREINWSNYRRLVDGSLEVRNHLVLVGPNDSGKSSILWALNLCLGMPGQQLASTLRPRDFTDTGDPLVINVTLGEFDANERAAFPDEITVGPPEVLVVRLDAQIDPVEPSLVTFKRYCPDAGTSRNLSRVQLDTIGWDFVPATRSLIRELGTSGGVARDLLSELDLTPDQAAFDDARESYRTALEDSDAIRAFRETLADALTDALPNPVGVDDVGIASAAELLNNPLADTTVMIRDGDQMAPLAEQSDGVRALSVLTLTNLSNQKAKVIGIDEPETHLHITAQRAITRGLLGGGKQRVVATHSSAVVCRAHPLDVGVFGADRAARQLSAGHEFANMEVVTRHWGHPLVEPLTARKVIVVEGPSDRVLLARSAELLGPDLDRAGIAVFELGSADMFPKAYALFGSPGFGIPVFGLVDSDAAPQWAAELGIPQADLAARGFVECSPDLEGAYVDGLGVQRVVDLLDGGDAYREAFVLSSCGSEAVANLTVTDLSNFCRHKRRKMRAALAIAQGITKADAQAVQPIASLLAQL